MFNLNYIKMTRLKKLYENEKIILPELYGHRTILKDREVFSFLKDDKLRILNKRERQTPKCEIAIYDLVVSATFDEIFHSLSDDLDSLCLTQHQILKVCENYKKYLKLGYATFFLVKKKRFFRKPKYYVIFVGNHGGGLDVGIYDFKDYYQWSPGAAHFASPLK